MTIKTGIVYPLQIVNGNLATANDFELTRKHVLSFLETFTYERIQVDYGIPLLLGDARNEGEINNIISSKLKREFPNLIFKINVALTSEGTVDIKVEFSDTINRGLETVNVNTSQA